MSCVLYIEIQESFILSLVAHRRPLGRLLRRISRNPSWQSDNTNEGRVAIRCQSNQYRYIPPNSCCPRQRPTGETIRAKLAYHSLVLSTRCYSTGATPRRAYDPTRDIDFIVPKRLQETDVLSILGNRVIEETLAGIGPQNRPERILLWPYEWHPSRSLDSESSVKSSTTLNTASTYSTNPLPQTRMDSMDIVYQKEGVLAPDPVQATDVITKVGCDQDRPTVARNEPSELSVETQSIMEDDISVQTISKSPPVLEHTAVNDSSQKGAVEGFTDLERQLRHLRRFKELSPTIREALVRGPIPCVTSPPSDLDSPDDLLLLPEIKDNNRTRASRIVTRLEYESFTRNIHIMGMGSVGQYLAHALASTPEPPTITLLMHLPLLIQQWHEEGGAITLVKDGQVQTRSGFRIESSADPDTWNHDQQFPGSGYNFEHAAERPNTLIGTLIVTTGPLSIIPALLAIKSRLGRHSTIYFVQDGLGIIEKVNDVVFPDPHNRPTYVLGKLSSKLLGTGSKFTVAEVQSGQLVCSIMPSVVESRHTGTSDFVISRTHFQWNSHARYLVKTLERAPVPRLLILGHKSFYCRHLQGLAVHAVLGPLSVMLDCSNDLILDNYSATNIIRLALAEIHQVIRSLPELRNMPRASKHFTAKRLERAALSMIRKSGKNITPMLQDLRAGRKTEVEFQIGYFVGRGKALGVDCPVCEMLFAVVKAKQWANSRETHQLIPFRDRLP